MKKLIILVTVVMSFGVASTVNAFYGGVDYMHTSVSDSGLDVDLGVLALKGGRQINENIAVEARLGFGIIDDSVGAVDVEMDYLWALYVKPGYKVEDTANLYLLVGFGGGEVSAGVLGSADDTGFTWGFGAEMMLSNTMGISLEYLVLPDIETTDVDSINLGVNFKF